MTLYWVIIIMRYRKNISLKSLQGIVWLLEVNGLDFMDFGLFLQLGFAVEVGLRDVWFIFDGLKNDFFVVVALAAIEQDVAFAFLFEELYRMTFIIFLQYLFLYIL